MEGGRPSRHEGVAPLDTMDALTQLSFVVHAMLERTAAEHDMSIVLARMLGILRDRRPTVNELARLLELDKSSVSGLVARAERRNFVQRTPSADDRRSVRVSLTEEGRRLTTAITAEFGAEVAALLSGLTPRDADALTRIAGTVVLSSMHRHGIDLSQVRE